jgi:hypothetical protein
MMQPPKLALNVCKIVEIVLQNKLVTDAITAIPSLMVHVPIAVNFQLLYSKTSLSCALLVAEYVLLEVMSLSAQLPSMATLFILTDM